MRTICFQHIVIAYKNTKLISIFKFYLYIARSLNFIVKKAFVSFWWVSFLYYVTQKLYLLLISNAMHQKEIYFSKQPKGVLKEFLFDAN